VTSSSVPASSSVSTSLHSSKAASKCGTESAYCKRMFQVFQMFQRHVASVSY
jgi:hypothetical protein